MAPTVSFWDCGEFIAVSYRLAISHPPGAPLFEMIYHLFTYLKIFSEESMRLNFVSTLCSSTAVMLTYLIIARTIEYWCKEKDSLVRGAIVMGGAFSGAVFHTFCVAFWFSAVETIVFPMMALMMYFCIWLTLVWMEKYQERGREKILLLIIYVLFLSSGVHIGAMTIVPAILILVLYVDRDMRTNWKPYVIGLALSTMIYAAMDFVFLLYAFNVVLFLKIIFFRKNWPKWLSVFIGLALFFVGYHIVSFTKGQLDPFLSFGSILFLVLFIIALFALKEKARYNSNFWFWIMFVSLTAYSVQSFIPIRAHLNPRVNENNPQTWESFQGYLERKQYGQESMLTAMFHRRTTWTEQFGVNPHCGFWGFLREQYFPPVINLPVGWHMPPLRNLHFVPLLIGLFGLWVQWRRDRRSALFLTICFLINSLGLLLYINFKIDEVRERFYFYAPGFALFTYFIGVGMAGIIQAVNGLVRREGLWKKIVVAVTAGACMIIPAMPVLCTLQYKDERGVLFSHSRAGNYIPWDYAYNILMTCAPTALFSPTAITTHSSCGRCRRRTASAGT